MPKKGETMSDELKAKMADGRRAANAAKLAESTEVTAESTQEEPHEPTNHSSDDPSIIELTKMVLELKKQLDEKNSQPDLATQLATALGGGSQVSRGRLVGTTEKYSVNKNHYEDPRTRLFAETRLKRIAFDSNYELEWDIAVTSYETKDGVQMKEPKFTLSLVQIVLDDDGEPTNRRIGKARMVFFEDPDTAIVVANQNGIEVDETNEEQFLNDMRFIRVRDWLLECFWAPKADVSKSNKTQMVIGGQVVDTWEVSSEGSARIDFSALNSKLKA